MKPVISALGMGLIVFGSYKIFNNLFGNTISTIISIAVGAILYCGLILGQLGTGLFCLIII